MCEDCQNYLEAVEEAAAAQSNIVQINKTAKLLLRFVPDGAEEVLAEGLESIIARTETIAIDYKKIEKV